MPPTMIEAFSGPVPLARKNADPDSWEWDDESRAPWELAGSSWQDFKTKWYGVTTGSHCDLLVNPNSPMLSLEPLPLFLEGSMTSILVRESYVMMFDQVWVNAMARARGIIITGQPGVGKTLFQYYLLVRLLQMKQVVLFTLDGEDLYLFYHDHVYTTGLAALWDEQGGLPGPKPCNFSQPNLQPREFQSSPSEVFVWSLFNIQERKAPNTMLIYPPCLPVQTTSPDPSKYKRWMKEGAPLFTGLPLWTRDELAQGLPLQHKYASLLDALNRAHLVPPEYGSDPLDQFPGARAILQNWEDGGVSPSVEDCLGYLLESAIHHFGFSAGDVYSAIFNPRRAIQLHEAAFDISNRDLIHAMHDFRNCWETSHAGSHWILAINPAYPASDLRMATWTVDFKSDWVARNLIPRLLETEDESIQLEIRFLQRRDYAQALAARFLEPSFAVP